MTRYLQMTASLLMTWKTRSKKNKLTPEQHRAKSKPLLKARQRAQPSALQPGQAGEKENYMMKRRKRRSRYCWHLFTRAWKHSFNTVVAPCFAMLPLCNAPVIRTPKPGVRSHVLVVQIFPWQEGGTTICNYCTLTRQCFNFRAEQESVVEDYFDVHAGDPRVTSDRTLSRLQTPRMDREAVTEALAGVEMGYADKRQALFEEHKSHFNHWMYLLWWVWGYVFRWLFFCYFLW